MNLGLASDDGNTNFQGARNPDAGLHVTFYEMEFVQEVDCADVGRKKGQKFLQLMVRIEKPGDILNVVDRLSTTDDQRRFPLHYANYLNMRNGKAGDISGTALSDWQLLSREQAEQLRSLHFYTVEQVANSSDAQIGAIGMIAGMAPVSFRDKARMFLRVLGDTNLAQKQYEEIERSRAREKTLADTIESMQSQLAALTAAQPAPTQAKGKAQI